MLYLRLEYQFFGSLSVLTVNLSTEFVIENSKPRQTKVLNWILKKRGMDKVWIMRGWKDLRKQFNMQFNSFLLFMDQTFPLFHLFFAINSLQIQTISFSLSCHRLLMQFQLDVETFSLHFIELKINSQ